MVRCGSHPHACQRLAPRLARNPVWRGRAADGDEVVDRRDAAVLHARRAAITLRCRASQAPARCRARERCNGLAVLMDSHIRGLVEKVWNYHRLNQTLAPADAIMVLCSHDTIVAERGAQVFLEGWAPLLIFSGGLGTITKNFWTEPEADQFAAIAVRMGVPRDKIQIGRASCREGVW